MSQRDRSAPSVETAPHWFFVWPSISAPTPLSAATGRTWATKPQEVKSSRELQVTGRVRGQNGAVGEGEGGLDGLLDDGPPGAEHRALSHGEAEGHRVDGPFAD